MADYKDLDTNGLDELDLILAGLVQEAQDIKVGARISMQMPVIQAKADIISLYSPAKKHSLLKRGWWCNMALPHPTCALRPYWWNITKDARRYRKDMRHF